MQRVELSGFRNLDSSVKDAIDKNLQRHLAKLERKTKKLETLKITLKEVHQKEKGEIYELHALLDDNGKLYSSRCTDRNLLAAIDRVLERLLNELNAK